jgi:hypothetical protein
MNLHYHRFRSIQALCLTLSVFLPTVGLNPITVNASQKVPPREKVDSFIIEMINGKATCRGAKPAEVASTLPRPTDVGVPVERLLPQDKSMPYRQNVGSGGLTINLVALSQLQNDANQATVIAAIERSAAVWTGRIKSPVTVTINVDYGPNAPGGGPFGSLVLGSTSSLRTLVDYPGARTNLIAGASGFAESAIYNQLPNSTFVPTDTANGGTVSVNRSVAFALGIPVIAPTNSLVATIGFNKNFSYDFNPDNGIAPGQTDFVAVATHEIGHALGFTSGAGAGPTSEITLWDIFRFRPGATTSSLSTGERIMSIGGSQVYFTSESFIVNNSPTNELELSTGGPDGVFDEGGDGNQSSHWKDDTLIGKFIGIMDPNLSAGVHEVPTENDFLAIEMLGWNLINSVGPPPPPPPPPPPANDNFGNAQTLSGCSGSVAGVNVGATHEVGEQQHFPAGGGGNGGGNRSVWYRWQAPASGTATFRTANSRFDTVLAVYTGSAVGSLLSVAAPSDDISGSDKTSKVSFAVTAGTTYRIVVDGYDNDSGGDFGPLALTWETTNCSVASPPQILLEQSGPVADQAAVFDSVLWLRDPFLVLNPANLLYPASDLNTRVAIFVANLPDGPVTVNLVDSNNQSYNITPQDVHGFTDLEFNQVTFRLPSGLPVGTCRVKVISQGQESNTATFRIRI